MPRGARALHAIHGDTPGRQLMTMVRAEEHYLLVTCWCEKRFVTALQSEVRWGVTRSCGDYMCVGPNGETEETLTAPPAGLLHPDPQWRLPVDRWDAPPASMRSTSTIRRHRPLSSGQEKRVRRDRVEALWKQSKRVMDIANELNEPYHVVYNDIKWLLVRDRIRK